MSGSRPTQDIYGFLNTGPEATFDLVCYTCKRYRQIQDAEGFCLDCSENMCTTCLKDHRKYSATKHHKIINKANMPGKQNISSASDICTERCQIHKDEIIKYFCPTHKVLGCFVCIEPEHKLCNDVTYIREAAADLSDSQEFKFFQNELEKLIKKSEYITKATQSNIRLSAEYRAKAVQEIETYRKELNDTLDKLKDELEHQSEEIEVKDSEKMAIVAYTSNLVLAELQHMASDINILLDKKQYSKLFIEMKNAEDKLTAIEDRLPKAEDIFVTVVRFKPNLELQKLIQRKDALGQLVDNPSEINAVPSEINAVFLMDINVKSPGNTATCYVTSAALLSENKLVITDLRNKSVKLIDTEHKQIISEYKTYVPPCDVTIVDQTQVAVTLPREKKIQFLKSKDELSLDKEIAFDRKCLNMNIACVDDKLIVSFSLPFEVRILNMAGDVLQSYVIFSQGHGFISRAHFLSASSINQAIYASSLEENCVTMLDMDGNIRAVYEDADLKTPRHTVVDDTGMVYVCGRSSNNIHLLTPDCKKVKILLSKQDGIVLPRGICYCKMTRRLFITMQGNNIKVFQLA